MGLLDPAFFDEDVVRAALAARDIGALYRLLRRGTQALSEPAPLALPTDQPLPTHLSISDVHSLRAVTHQLRDVARYYGGQAGPFRATANYYTQWMRVPATDEVKAALAAALAELHTEAGWCSYDSGLDGSGHFTHALWFADHAGDTYGIANAAWNAGLTLVRSGHPNDALKLFQLGSLCLSGAPTTGDSARDDPRIAALTARLDRQSATAYAVMKGHDEATRCLAKAHDRWEPRDAYERAGADLTIAGIQLDLNQIDTAERFAASAARTYAKGHRQGRATADLLLAEIHIRAGEPQGLALAHHAIHEVRTLHSVAARRERLIPNGFSPMVNSTYWPVSSTGPQCYNVAVVDACRGTDMSSASLRIHVPQGTNLPSKERPFPSRYARVSRRPASQL